MQELAQSVPQADEVVRVALRLVAQLPQSAVEMATSVISRPSRSR